MDVLANSVHSVQAREARTDYSKLGTIDKSVYHKAIGTLSEHDRWRVLRTQLLADWSDAKQLAFYPDDAPGKCFHCGADECDTLHLWICPAMQDVRDSDPAIGQLNATFIPRHVLLGIPDVLDASYSGDLLRLTQEDALTLANLPISEGLCFDHRSTLDIEDAVQRTCGSASDMNIIELAYHHLSYVGKSPMPRVQPCEGSSPVLANAWTDGSYRNPGKRLAVGSFGVWHPTRDPGDLRPEECDFASPIPQAIHGQPAGLMLAGVLPGVFNSSTRTELAAFIAICASPCPLNIGIDNNTVVQRTNAIASGTLRRRRDWSLLPDGDLWQIAEECIRIRGPQATWSSWHKSHATWSQLASGAVKPCNAINNGIADLAGAGLVVALPGEDVLCFSCEVVTNKHNFMFRGATHLSNNVAELTGAVLCLEHAATLPPSRIIIGYDSEYARRTITGEWRARRSARLVARGRLALRRLMASHIIEWQHIDSHTGHTLNDLADHHASLGADGVIQLPLWCRAGLAGGGSPGD